MAPDGSRSISAWGSLASSSVLLILMTSGAILGVSLYTAERTVSDLSRTVIERTQVQTETELDRFFQPVTANLLTARRWGSLGELDPTNVEAMNARFIPMLENMPQVTSMMVGTSRGVEYMLLKDGKTWLNRESRANEWGSNTRWSRWRDPETLVEKWDKVLEYDPRKRPWFRAALEGDGSRPAWTEPYTFFTTKDPGITASLRWKTPSGETYVVGFDVMLIDVSKLTTLLAVSKGGTAVVVSEDGRMVGLPRDSRFESAEGRKAAVLKGIGDLHLPTLEQAHVAWKGHGAEGEPIELDTDDGTYWTGFRPYRLGETQRLLLGVVVPESDLLGDARQQQGRILLITLGAVVLALGVAFLINRRVTGRFTTALEKARKLGQYTLERKLGEGAMGEVYLARHAMLRRPTAIKLLHPERAESEQALKRFEREVQLTAELTSPHTISIFDYGRTDEGVFYYAMEYLAGATLDDVVRRDGPMPPERVIFVLRQVCESLAEAHSNGLVHRDVKPANIMICPMGGRHDFVKVLDFGLVKEVESDGELQVTRKNTLAGTPMYMAPEMITEDGSARAESDVYALGAVAYFLVTGKSVFEGDTVISVLSSHLTVPPPLPSSRTGRRIPDDLEAVIMRCLEKRPEDRFRSAEELAEALGACADAGAWDEAQAKAWWSDLGTREPAPAPPSVRDATGPTLTVDLDERPIPLAVRVASRSDRT